MKGVLFFKNGLESTRALFAGKLYSSIYFFTTFNFFLLCRKVTTIHWWLFSEKFLYTKYPTSFFFFHKRMCFFYWSHSCIIFVSMVLHWRGEAREDLCTSTAVTREAPLTRTLLISRYTGHSGQGETWRCILELQRHCAGPTPRGVAFMTSVNIHTHTPLIW